MATTNTQINQSDVMSEIHELGNHLNRCLIGKRETIEALLVSLMAKEHVYFIGPPGTGKSLMASLLAESLTSACKEIQFSRRTTEDEIFGPLDIKALVPDEGPSRYVRVRNPHVTYAQDAEVLIMDEPANASPAILKGFHALLQERRYHDGEQWYPAPLKVCIGTSNEELPEDCFALRDRFAIKRVESYLSGGEAETMREAHLSGALKKHWASVPSISPEVFEQAHEIAMQIKWSEAALASLTAIVVEADASGIKISDRSQIKALDILRAFALYTGKSTVRVPHLRFAKNVLWDELVDREKIGRIIDDAIEKYADKLDTSSEIITAWFSEPEIVAIKHHAHVRRDGRRETWEGRTECISRACTIFREASDLGRDLRSSFGDDANDICTAIKAELTDLINDCADLGVNLQQTMAAG